LQAASHITKEDLERIEEKLDRLLEFFRVGQVPNRPAQELSSLADAKILQLTNRKRKNKRGHGREENI